MIPLRPNVYVAPGTPAPAWLWRDAGQVRVLAHAGPEACPGGTVYGTGYEPGNWQEFAPGLWLHHTPGLLPQHLRKLETDQRILHWSQVAGPLPGHQWQVPALIGWDQEARTWYPATDRLLGSQGWQEPVYARAQASLAGLASGADLERHPDEALIDLAAELLAVGQHCDRALLAHLGWLSEATVLRVIRAAYVLPEVSHGA
jgi:hypothetical protein